MERIDLSTNSKKIQELYNKVVRGDGSTTYGVFSVDKNGVLDATTAGDGDLTEFVEEFSDGQVQFGLARVTVPGSDVFKNLLLGWCPDNAPAKLRLSFATNFADVSRVLSGYHIQITARDSDDLDVDEFISRVGAAAGARYLIQTASGTSITKKPAPKPAATVTSSTKSAPQKPASFIPKSTGKPTAPFTPKPVVPKPAGFSAPKPAQKEEDEWDGEQEIKERDFSTQPLEDVPSAYKPTKVDINELRKQKSDTISSQPKAQPIKQAEETQLSEPKSLNDRVKSFQLPSDDGRLTSLPKPKINHSVGSRYTAAASEAGPSFGSKPTFGQNLNKKDNLVGGLSRNFGAENGKTPAQLWAEKRGQYKDVQSNDKPVSEHAAADDSKNELEHKFKSLQVNKAQEEEEEQEADEEEEEQPEEKETPKFTPTIIKPATGGFQPPAAKDDDEEEDEEDKPAPIPSLPARNLPPPPTRNDSTNAAPKTEEPATPSLPARNLPPLPSREESAVSVPKAEEPAAPATPARESSSASQGITAIAQYDYEKDEDNEVEFNEGDLIIEIEFVDEEWWSGKNPKTGEVGLFPGSYVTVNENEKATEKALAAPVETSKPTAPEPASEGKSAIAEYDYVKDEDNEISFDEGDLIVEIDFVDEDWWSGKHKKTGSVGLFPSNYVKLQ